MIEILNYDNLTNLFIEISQFTGGRYLIIFTDNKNLTEWLSELNIYSEDLGYTIDAFHRSVRCKRNDARIRLLTIGEYENIKSFTYDKILYEDGVDAGLLSNIRPRSSIFNKLKNLYPRYENSDALSDFLSDFSIIN